MNKLKYIKLMADYSSTGVWERGGANADLSEFPLSESLQKEITDWCDYYEINDDWQAPENRRQPLFDLKSFSIVGLAIAKKIKKELPDYQVMYFDEYKSSQKESRYLYEIF